MSLDLFIALKKFCKEKDIEISDFWKTKNSLNGNLYETLKIFEELIQWKSGPQVLLRRIRRIGRNKNFSVRETKLLRKLINAQRKKGYENFEEILDEFPGKTIEMLKEKYFEKFKYLESKRKYHKRQIV